MPPKIDLEILATSQAILTLFNFANDICSYEATPSFNKDPNLHNKT